MTNVHAMTIVDPSTLMIEIMDQEIMQTNPIGFFFGGGGGRRRNWPQPDHDSN